MAIFESIHSAATPVRAGRTQIVPFVKTVHLQLPDGRGSFVWSRPAAVWVRFPDGRESVLPIRDVTRWLQILIWGMALLGLGLLWFNSRKR